MKYCISALQYCRKGNLNAACAAAWFTPAPPPPQAKPPPLRRLIGSHLCAGYLQVYQPQVQLPQRLGVSLQLELGFFGCYGRLNALEFSREFPGARLRVRVAHHSSHASGWRVAVMEQSDVAFTV
jgi:hypothetical protein